MEGTVQQKLALVLKNARKKKRLKTIVASLCVLVALGTSYVLINPASSQEKQTYCGYEEHEEHTDECYGTKLVCGLEETEGHVHTEECVAENKILTCDKEETEGHIHTEECMVEERTLICELEETDGHIHSDECFEKLLICENEDEDHVHTEDCFEIILICEDEEMESHHHSEDCYISVTKYVCGQEEAELHHHDESCYSTVIEYICGSEECSPHQHTSDCYAADLDKLMCGKPIHKHTLQCYSNPDADVETTSVWENMFVGKEMTGDWRQDVIAVAKSQLGYTESVENYQVLEDGTTIKGYTRYGAWYGDDYGDWCAMFCSFCLHYAGVDQELMPQEAACNDWIDKLEEIDRYYDITEYVPDSGDLIFFDWDLDGSADHVGFVYEVSEASEDESAKITTIEGNKENCVKYDTYSMDDESILGFGVLPENPDMTVDEQITVREPEVAAGDIIGGHAWVVNDSGATKKLKMMAGPARAKGLASTAGETDTPIDVATQNHTIVISYQEKGASEWIEIENNPDGTAVEIPANAKLKIDVDFSNVNIDQLLAAGATMTLALPAVMEDPQVSSPMYGDEDEEVAEITAESGLVTIKFDEEWLRKNRVDESSKVSGDFWVVSGIDITEAKEHYPGGLVVGDVEINVDFGEDIIEKFSNVDVIKSEPTLHKDDDGWYLLYDVTVTASEDGCPTVLATDSFTDTTYIDDYEIISVTRQLPNQEQVTVENPVTSGGISGEPLVWNVGDMAPNETDTITYKVRVSDDYFGGSAKDSLINKVNVTSKDYPKDSDESKYEPTASVTVSKKNKNGTVNPDSGGSVNYTATVAAPSGNDYTLEHVDFRDTLSTTVAAAVEFVDYNQTKPITVVKTSADGKTKTTYTVPWNAVTMLKDGKSFEFSFDEILYPNGELAPGEKFEVSYSATIDERYYPAIGDTDSSITNTVGVILDEDGETDKTTSSTLKVTHKEWVRKQSGERQPKPIYITIPTTDEVYDENGNSLSPETFEVPEGSYMYRCVANETGDWDITSASLTDEMDKAYMKYQGYVRIDVYYIDDNAPKPGDSDDTVVANLLSRTDDIVKTVWVKIDGKNSFDIALSDLNLTGENAYLLTYYAMPVTEDQLVNVQVGNTFGIEGDVVNKGEPYTLVGVEDTKVVDIVTDESFTAEKLPWYYESIASAEAHGLDNYPYGALYWMIRADGYMASGTQFMDGAESQNDSFNYRHYFRDDSVIGLYKGDLSSIKKLGDYDLIDLLQSGLLTEVENPEGNPYYSVSYYKNNDSLSKTVDPMSSETASQCAVITLERQIKLEDGESLYILLRTTPSKNTYPSGTSTSKTFYNKLQAKGPTSPWTDEQVVEEKLYVHNHISKDAYIGTYDGKTMTGDLGYSVSDSRIPTISSSVANSAVIDGVAGGIEPGTYVNWFIRLDNHDNIGGRYRVIDPIPDGLEPEFIYWYSSTINFTPVSVRLRPNELPSGSTWTEHVTTMKGTKGTSTKEYDMTVYWYSDENNNVLFEFDGFESAVGSNRGVQLILGTRITDEDVLLGGETGQYDNTIYLYDDDGYLNDKDSVSISHDVKTMKKSGEWKESDVNIYPFVIDINPLGEDLLATKDNLTIKDTMSDNLTFDPGSVVVKVTGSDPEVIVTDYTVTVDPETNSFSITVPDELPLTITYNARVNVRPGVVTSLWNKAHWEGIEDPYEVIHENQEFVYDIGGSASADTPPKVKVTKYDRAHAERKLKGAKFELTEMAYDETTKSLVPKTDGLVREGVTDQNGTYTFGTDNQMTYNTVYRLVETEAPYAYELDETPHYFLVMKENSTIPYPEWIEDLPEGIKVDVWDTSPTYPIVIYDDAIQYELPETGSSGTFPIYTLGLLLIAIAVMCGYYLRRWRERRYE